MTAVQVPAAAPAPGSSPERPAPADRRRAYVEMIMGLPFSIHTRGGDGGPDELAAVESVWASLKDADRVFSTYRPDSDISRIATGTLALKDADPRVAAVLDLAADARRVTAGAFDVHYAGPLDPAGVVKGWAAARAAAALEDLDTDWYLNAGGDVLVRSRSGEPWRVGIEHPERPDGLMAVLTLANGAVATSGATHRGSHLVNPVTHRPATGIRQVTVCGPDLTWSDVYATAMAVSPGPLTGRWELPEGYEFLVVTDAGAVTASPGMARLLGRPEGR